MSAQVIKFLQQENQRLLEENREQRNEVMALKDYLAGLHALQQAAESITAEEDPLALLDKTLYGALTVIDASDGSVVLRDQETDELVFAVVHGKLRLTLPGHRIAAGSGIAGWVAEHREPQVVNNVRSDPRFDSQIDDAFQFQTASLLCVPMISRGQVLGVIEVLNKYNERDFTSTDVDLLTILAFIAAAAIDRLEGDRAISRLGRSG
jgi:GAF domain-containing protein